MKPGVNLFLFLIASIITTSYIHAQDPGTAGFTPFKYYPCSQINPRGDFHPLRPYPSSPCDPYILRKNPEAAADPNLEYLTFSCNNSLNLDGSYTVLDFVPTGLSGFPGDCTANLEDSNGATNAYNNYYDCGGSVCLVHEVIFDFNIDLSPTRLPIIGNAEFPAGDAILLNSYLDWYLNGTVLHADQQTLDPTNVLDMRRLSTASGPIIKQLPQQIQTDIRNSIKSAPPINSQMHNYEIQNTRMLSAGTSLYKYLPLTTQEDTTSEVTVGLTPGSQPSSNGYIINSCATTRPFEIALGADPSDSRIYFPHVRGDDALSDLLASLSRPFPTGVVSSGDTLLFSREINQHQGLNDSTQVQRRDYLTVGRPGGPNTRNTEVNGRSVFYPDRYRAPQPITEVEPPPVCEKSISLTNYGDRVMGKDFNSTLVYYQHFEYDPQYRGTINGCQLERQTCTVDTDCCAFNAGCSSCDCSGYQPGHCSGPGSCPTLPRSVCQLVSVCTWHDARPGRCGRWPRRDLDSRARVDIFTKSPLVESIYDTLVIGNQSVLRRFLPLRPDTWPNPEYIQGETNIENTIPGESVTNYTGSTSDLNNPTVSGGDGNLPIDIYYDRLGSLSDHFLGDITGEKANLQKMLRPKDLIPTPITTPGLPGVPSGVRQHLFENSCGQICYNYLIGRILNETSCSGEVLNPYFAVAIALNENGGLVSCEPGATRTNHYGCDPYGAAGYGTTIQEKTTCMINTLSGYCRSGYSDLEILQRYGYANGASDLSPLPVLNNPTTDLFVSASSARSYASSLLSLLPTQRNLWWHYYCGYINNYAQSSCGQTLDACNTLPPP